MTVALKASVQTADAAIYGEGSFRLISYRALVLALYCISPCETCMLLLHLATALQRRITLSVRTSKYRVSPSSLPNSAAVCRRAITAPCRNVKPFLDTTLASIGMLKSIVLRTKVQLVLLPDAAVPQCYCPHALMLKCIHVPLPNVDSKLGFHSACKILHGTSQPCRLRIMHTTFEWIRRVKLSNAFYYATSTSILSTGISWRNYRYRV